MDTKELKNKVKENPIKKSIEFDALFDVVAAVAQKGDLATLKMLKQVHDAYEEQNPEIAEAFFDVLKNSLIRETGDIPTSVHIPSKAKGIVEDCFYDMLKNKNASQQIVDLFAAKKTLEDYDETNPSTFLKKN